MQLQDFDFSKLSFKTDELSDMICIMYDGNLGFKIKHEFVVCNNFIYTVGNNESIKEFEQTFKLHLVEFTNQDKKMKSHNIPIMLDNNLYTGIFTYDFIYSKGDIYYAIPDIEII